MGAIRHQVKVTTTGKLTPASLASTLHTLYGQGVPEDAALEIQGDGRRSVGFTLTASWPVEDKPGGIKYPAAPPYLMDPDPDGVPIAG